MASEIDQDAQHYWAILRTPADGWGHHCCPKTGMASHWYMLKMFKKHGDAAFDAALERNHPYPHREKAEA